MRKRIFSAAGIFLGLVLLGGLSRVLEANYDGNQAFAGFYALDEQTVDVMFYGSSHIYSGVNPATLWAEFGISAYNLAGTYQYLWNSYYNMEETLKYQRPEVMVVDLYGATFDEEYGETTNFVKNVSSMRFSLNKVRNVYASVPKEKFLESLMGYPLVHDSYPELSRGNYERGSDLIGGDCYKGFRASFEITAFDSLPDRWGGVKAERESTEKNRKYLEKMVKLAEKEDVELLFIVVPYAGYGEVDAEYYNWAERFATENGVGFLNGNELAEEIGLDGFSDFAEESHMNYSGAEKFSRYLGDYLKGNYILPDRRGEEAYDSWDEYSDCWERYLWGRELKKLDELGTYLIELASREDYIIVLSFQGDYRELDGLEKGLSALGKVWQPDGGEGITVIENGESLYSSPQEAEYLWYLEMGKSDLAVRREYGGNQEIIVDRQIQNKVENGLNVYVYDRRLDMPVDSVGFGSEGNRAYR